MELHGKLFSRLEFFLRMLSPIKRAREVAEPRRGSDQIKRQAADWATSSGVTSSLTPLASLFVLHQFLFSFGCTFIL